MLSCKYINSKEQAAPGGCTPERPSITTSSRDELTVTDIMPLPAADPVFALSRKHVRLGYDDRQARLAKRHLSPQVAPTERNGSQATSGHDEPGPDYGGEAASEPCVEARIESLDGSERKLLLDQLARAYPDVVEAGFGLVAQWRAEAAEHRRAKLRHHEHARRRHRRAELGDG
jgi:hypothetical protein